MQKTNALRLLGSQNFAILPEKVLQHEDSIVAGRNGKDFETLKQPQGRQGQVL